MVGKTREGMSNFGKDTGIRSERQVVKAGGRGLTRKKLITAALWCHAEDS
jgi:hypothetical protein